MDVFVIESITEYLTLLPVLLVLLHYCKRTTLLKCTYVKSLSLFLDCWSETATFTFLSIRTPLRLFENDSKYLCLFSINIKACFTNRCSPSSRLNKMSTDLDATFFMSLVFNWVSFYLSHSLTLSSVECKCSVTWSFKCKVNFQIDSNKKLFALFT